MPLQSNQGAVIGANFNTTPGSCDNGNAAGIAIPSPTGPVLVSATAPLPVTPVPGPASALTPFPPTPFIIVVGVSVVIFVVPAGCKYICISVHSTAPGTLYLSFSGPAVAGSGISLLPGTNYIFDASSGVPAAATIISAISGGLNHVAVEFFT